MMKRTVAIVFLLTFTTLAGAQTPAATAGSAQERGLAAVYSDALHGRITASGEVYDKSKMTAAHKTLPYGTTVRVTNIKNNKSVVLRINDRGPRQAGRILDISPAAARQLGFSRKVMREVTLDVVEIGTGKTRRQPKI